MLHLYESADQATKVASLFRELAQPQRIMILLCLGEGTKKVSEIELETQINQPALSQQLCRLRKFGFIMRIRLSREVYYSISDDSVVDYVKFIKDLV